MEKERIIKITDLEADGEDAVELTTRGVLRGDENNYSLHYEEIFGEGLSSKTVIRVKNKKSASIIRKGSINTEIMLEAGKRHNCSYQTPYGDMMVGVFAREVFSSVGEHGGELRLHYTVDLNGSLNASKEMVISVGDVLQ